MSIDIYSFKMSPFCRSVLMLGRELNIDLNVIETDPGAGQQFNETFLKLNPIHSLPTIIDNGFVLWESRAILQYLANKYQPDGTLYPKDPKKRAIIDRWLNFDMSLLTTVSRVSYSKTFLGVDPTPENLTALQNNLKIMNQLIGDNKFLTGDNLTIADLALVVTTFPLTFSGYDLTDYPNLNRWLTSLPTELPYFGEINNFSPESMLEWAQKSQDYIKRKLQSF